MSDKKTVFLIGFMGTGKSTAGEIASHLLGFDFIDTDNEIEKETGMTIPDIFREKGEETFRVVESAVLKNVSQQPFSVIACGGGVVMNEKNRRLLDRNPYVIWLKSPAEVCVRRCTDANRPLLSGTSLSGTKRLMAEREPYYRQVSKIEIETTGLSPGEVAENIALKVEALMTS